MKKLKVILFVNVLLFAGMFANGSVELERVSSDANWLACFDCDLFHKSVMGEVLKNRLTELGVEERLENFSIIFGFNPLEDVKSVMLYGKGRDRQEAVLLIEGKFDTERLLALVGTNDEYKKLAYDDKTIHQWRQKEKKDPQNADGHVMYGCFFRDDLVMLSSGLPVLEDAIDVIKGIKKSTSNELFKDSLLTDSNVFLHIAAMNIDQLVGDEPNAAIFKQTEQIIIGVGQDSENIFASINLKANSNETAENITKLLDGVIAWLSLAGNEKPGLAKMAQMIKITTDAETIKIRLELNTELIQQIIENHAGKM